MVALLLFILAFPLTAESRDEELLKRLQELEEQVLELQLKETGKAPVTAFDAIKLDFGGFITQTFTSTFNGDSPDRSSFDQTNLEFLVGADITENHRFFTAVGFLRQSDLVNEATATDVSQRRFAPSANRVPGIILWGQHTFSDLFEVTYGRFIDPWGIINIEHFPPVLMSLNQPQYLRNIQPGNLFGGNTIIPNFLNGIMMHGSKFFGNHRAEYYGYTSNFNGQGSSDFISGARLAWTLPNRSATLGGSYQNGVRDDATNDHYDAFGLDFKVKHKGFLLKSEYIYSNIKNRDNRESYYIQPAYKRGDWLVFYRFDFLDLNTTIEDDAS